MTPFLIILMAYLDRIRGSDFRIVKGDIRLLMGWCLAALMGHELDILTLPIVILFAIGEAPGWGAAIGPGLESRPMDQTNLEWWQKGILKTNTYLALAVRGVMWGLPVALLGYFDHNLLWLPLIIGIAMPLAVWAVSLTTKDWGHQEILRGLLVGSMVAAV